MMMMMMMMKKKKKKKKKQGEVKHKYGERQETVTTEGISLLTNVAAQSSSY